MTFSLGCQRGVAQNGCRKGVGGEERLKMLPQSSTVLEPNFLRSSDHHEAAVTIPGKILLEFLFGKGVRDLR